MIDGIERGKKCSEKKTKKLLSLSNDSSTWLLVSWGFTFKKRQ